MRIAFLIERFEPGTGGVENVAWTVAHALVKAGDEVHVVARHIDPSAGTETCRVDVSDRWQPNRVRSFAREVARVASRGAFDIVYSLARTTAQDVYRAGAGSHADYMERRYRGIGARMRRVSPRHATLLALERRVFRDPSQTIVCNSEMVRDQIRHRYRVDPHRMVVIRNGVDSDRFRLAEPLASEARDAIRSKLDAHAADAWLFAGSGFERKGLDTALATLTRSRSTVQLWVVGGDRDQRWRRTADRLGVGSRVRFLGFRSDMPELFAAADGLLLPSRYDACANVCLEAAAAGLPIVTTSTNGASEVLGEAGAIIDDPEDVSAFVDAIDRLGDRALRSACGRAAQRVAERLTWTDHTAKLRALFDSVVRLQGRR